MADAERDTHAKALTINLDPTIYGSIAEIGAGQEVARWFLQAGGASGTVARTVSAYDMNFSDALYGKVGRYVSRERLQGMLDYEYRLLIDRLAATKGAQTRLFAFADTISARNFAGTNECHGWVGLRFQSAPGAPPNDVILHLNLLDPSNLLQQQAVGILGVNLIDAAFYARQTPDSFMAAIFDDLAHRVEIDVIACAGPDFAGFDATAATVELVRKEFAEAVVLPIQGPVVPPSEMLRKRPLILSPGGLPGHEAILGAMLAGARAEMASELGPDQREPLPLVLLNAALRRGAGKVSTADLARRADALRATGADVLVARASEIYHVVRYALRYTTAPIRVVVGAPALADVLQAQHYEHLDGAIMEALAQLFACNVCMYVHPVPRSTLAMLDTAASAWITGAGSDGMITLDDLVVPPPLSHLLAYLVGSGFLRPIVSDLNRPTG